jgi:hypothetical protein
VGPVEIRWDLGEEIYPCKQAIVCAGDGLSRQAHLERSTDRSEGILFGFPEADEGRDAKVFEV